jgi:uncharacterized membrane protein YhaH (DUF805 family)
MSFEETVNSGFSNYSTFSGRLSRSAYWYWVLLNVLVSIGTSVIDVVVGLVGVFFLSYLVLLVPSFAVTVRRLHDLGRSGLNLVWGFVPILGPLYILYLMVQPIDAGRNLYGEVPIEERTPLAGHA